MVDLYLCDDLGKARAIIEVGLEAYNAIRRHESPGGLPPYGYAVEARTWWKILHLIGSRIGSPTAGLDVIGERTAPVVHGQIDFKWNDPV